MSDTSPDSLLSTLVGNIRQTCEKHVQFENFISVSGLICFDIDGCKQQCFVISEFLQKKSSGEGHSTHLKTLNWNDINRKGSFIWHPNEKGPSSDENQPLETKEEENDISQHSSHSSRLHGSTGANLNAKLDWSNRTFTLKPSDCAKSTCNPERNISSITITVSRDSPNSSSTGLKRNNPQSDSKENMSQASKCARRNSLKSSTLLQNCYPNFPKKPVKTIKRPKLYRHESAFEKQSRSSINNSTFELSPKTTVSPPKRYNSPSEKPTSLGWFENIISPSGSIESIDSIQPFYLIPQGDNSSLPPSCEDSGEGISQGHGGRASQLRTQAEQPDPQTKLHSPARTLAPHVTSSNATLNTVSSIEPDGLVTVKERSPDRLAWSSHAETISMIPSPDAHTISGQVPSECSTVSKKRASLLKWMGLFKKAHKTSSSVSASKGISQVGSVSTNRKQSVKARQHSITEPLLGIRLKKWN